MMASVTQGLMATDDIRTFQIAATAEGIHLAVEAFTQFTGAGALTQDDVWEIRVALDEWLTNVVEHAYESRSGEVIDVQFRLTASELEVSVTDDGPVFDPLTLPPPDTAAPIADRKPGGLGVYFIGRLMDRVDHTRIGGRNTLVFAKRVSRKP